MTDWYVCRKGLPDGWTIETRTGERSPRKEYLFLDGVCVGSGTEYGNDFGPVAGLTSAQSDEVMRIFQGRRDYLDRARASLLVQREEQNRRDDADRQARARAALDAWNRRTPALGGSPSGGTVTLNNDPITVPVGDPVGYRRAPAKAEEE